MARTLRATEIGTKFLQQFDFGDAGLAASFVENLILVTHREFHLGLLSTLDGLVDQADRPLALFAAREVVDVPYFHEHDRESRPSAVAAGAKVGSEGPIANLVRDVARRHGPGKVLDHPHIESMRATKVRKIVVVDDIIGSGKRIWQFIHWLLRDKTIKSWVSYGYVRFVAVAYAATDLGRKRALAVAGVESVISTKLAESGRAVWTESERSEYVSLCERYGHKTSRSRIPLGFGSAMTMMIFEHKCPNTTPAIVWAEKKDEWVALFPERPEFLFDKWPESPSEAEKLQSTLRSLGQPTLSELHWMKYVSPDARMRFLLLAALAKRRLTVATLSDIAGVDVADCERKLRECRRFGWITPENRITDEGLSELHHARTLRLVQDECPGLTQEIYVPQSFRGSQRPI